GATRDGSLSLHDALPISLVRWALIVPWAASVIMTSKLFAWIYDYYFGVLNPALQALGILSHPVDWLGDDATVMGAMIAVGVFVSDRKSTRLNSSHVSISY